MVILKIARHWASTVDTKFEQTYLTAHIQGESKYGYNLLHVQSYKVCLRSDCLLRLFTTSMWMFCHNEVLLQITELPFCTGLIESTSFHCSSSLIKTFKIRSHIMGVSTFKCFELFSQNTISLVVTKQFNLFPKRVLSVSFFYRSYT